MRGFFLNAWTITIVGGAISTIIASVVSGIIFNKKDKLEYLRQVDFANKEVINKLKVYIADRELPNKDIIYALISSVSRKYKVRKESMFSVTIFCEELVMEIIDNVYIPLDKKDDYTTKLAEYISNLNSDVQLNTSYEIADADVEYYYMIKLIRRYRFISGITAGISSIIVIILLIKFTDVTVDNLIYYYDNYIKIITILGILMFLVKSIFDKIIKKHQKNNSFRL